MSLPQKTAVRCSKCGKEFQFTYFDTISTEQGDNIPQKVISGELFQAKCPSCGTVRHIVYPVLYQDTKHKAMIKILYGSDFDQQFAMLLNDNVQIMAKAMSYRILRVVRSLAELREKVMCLEAGRDDRLVELLKTLAESQFMRTHPDFPVESMFYENKNGTERVIIHGTDKRTMTFLLDNGMYSSLKSIFYNLLSKMDTSRFQVIDFRWAADMFRKLTGSHP